MSADIIIQRIAKAAERISTLESQVEDLKSKLAAAEAPAEAPAEGKAELLAFLKKNFDTRGPLENQTAYNNLTINYGNTHADLDQRVQVLTRLKGEMEELKRRCDAKWDHYVSSQRSQLPAETAHRSQFPAESAPIGVSSHWS